MIYPIINYNNTDIPTNNELPYMNNTNINVFSDNWKDFDFNSLCKTVIFSLSNTNIISLPSL